jgi:TonB family protein
MTSWTNSACAVLLTLTFAAAAGAASPGSSPGPQKPTGVPDRPPIAYPTAAYDAGVEGYVRLRIVIAPDGAVTDATVVEAHPVGWFEEAAITGVKHWRYRAPGREVIAEVLVEFKLPPEEEPETVTPGK